MSNAERIASSQFSALGVVGPERLPPEVVELLTLALRRGATDILLAVDGPRPIPRLVLLPAWWACARAAGAARVDPVAGRPRPPVDRGAVGVAATRADPRHGPDGERQVNRPGRDHRAHQRDPRQAHHDHRGPGGVRARRQAEPGGATRGGAGHAVVLTGAAQRLPPEPRRRPGRRDA